MSPVRIGPLAISIRNLAIYGALALVFVFTVSFILAVLDQKIH
jgi:hypothetical protein